MYRPTYDEVQLRHQQLIREAKKQRLIASLKNQEPRRRWFPQTFSLRSPDLRPAI